MKLREVLLLGQLAVFVAAPIVLLAVPPKVVASGPTLCLYKRATGCDCPGCGTVRAFSCIAHSQWAAAWGLNKLTVVTFPLASCLWAWHTLKLGRRVFVMVRGKWAVLNC